MSRRVLVVRPEPGNALTVAALRAAGAAAEAMPLFAIRPLAWTPPDPAGFDALLLTSANAARHGGDGLRSLGLPVLAVGAATAAAARAQGLEVALTGEGDGASLVALARAQGDRRLLHLAGRDHEAIGADRTIAVYASEALPLPPDAALRLRGVTVLLHSARAARAVAALADDRGATALAAISPAVLAAAGAGWRAGIAAAVPTDAALIAAALMLDALTLDD